MNFRLLRGLMRWVVLASELRLGFLPERAIDLLIEWRTAGWILAEGMVIAPHQIRAVGKSPAGSLVVETPVGLEPTRKIGLCQRGPSHSDDLNGPARHVGRRGLHREFLQP